MNDVFHILDSISYTTRIGIEHVRIQLKSTFEKVQVNEQEDGIWNGKW